MRVVVNTPQGAEPIAFQETENPQPGASEALVAVRAFSVNRGELALLKARPEGWRPGQDVAGVVLDQAEDGTGPAAGSRVVGMVPQGGWSQFAAISTKRIAVLPDSVSVEQAAALPMAGLTALRTVRIGGALLGRRVLVTGANGGLGRFQIELAALSGAEVTAVTTKAETAGKDLRSLGASDVVADIADAEGLYDLVLESVGGASLAGAVKKVAPGATVVVLGASSGETAPVTVFDFFGHEQAKLQNYMSYASTDPDDRDLQTLVDLVAADKLHPTLANVADWSDLSSVIGQMRERTLPGGKNIFTISV